MINGETMVVLLVLIAVVGGIVKQRYKAGQDWRGQAPNQPDGPEAARLRDDVRQLRERVQVLERVITDNRRSTDLDDEIERLRDRQEGGR